MDAKLRISEKKTKFYLSFLEWEYLRRSQSFHLFSEKYALFCQKMCTFAAK